MATLKLCHQGDDQPVLGDQRADYPFRRSDMPASTLASTLAMSACSAAISVLVARLPLSKVTCSSARASLPFGETALCQPFDKTVSVERDGFGHAWIIGSARTFAQGLRRRQLPRSLYANPWTRNAHSGRRNGTKNAAQRRGHSLRDLGDRVVERRPPVRQRRRTEIVRRPGPFDPPTLRTARPRQGHCAAGRSASNSVGLRALKLEGLFQAPSTRR